MKPLKEPLTGHLCFSGLEFTGRWGRRLLCFRRTWRLECYYIWGVSVIRASLFWGPYNKDPTI